MQGSWVTGFCSTSLTRTLFQEWVWAQGPKCSQVSVPMITSPTSPWEKNLWEAGEKDSNSRMAGGEDGRTEMRTWTVDRNVCHTIFYFFPENVSKPNIWVEPGSVIPLGTHVTIWCQGTQNTKVFHLQKKGTSESRHKQSLIKTGDKTNFSIPYMTDKHTGEYCCHYLTKANTWSENSDTLNLVVTGEIMLISQKGELFSRGS